MKSLAMVLTFLFASLSCFAGIEVRNGGGGWTNEGQYMTFYSAKIPVQKKALTPEEIPGLSYLVSKMFSLKTTERIKTQILKTIFPVTDRSYYTTNAEKFDERLKKDLCNKYADIMGVSQDNIAIFATTNPASSETVLLPDFYKLRESEQAAILFHESLWILSPRLNYINILAAEEAAQAYFENAALPENVYAFYYQLSLLMDDRSIPLSASLDFDKEQNIFPSKLAKTAPLEALLGRDFLNCLAESDSQTYRLPTLSAAQRVCSENLFSPVVKSSMKKPSSVFYKSLLDFLKREGDIAFIPEQSHRLSDLANPNLFLNIVPKESETLGLSFTVVNSYNEIVGYLTFN
ncbi:MAG: hypothetical protein ACKOX6_18540 [Bdellovibrio sp.]